MSDLRSAPECEFCETMGLSYEGLTGRRSWAYSSLSPMKEAHIESSVYRRYDPAKSDAAFNARFVRSNLEIYGIPPWNEWKACTRCSAFWGDTPEGRAAVAAVNGMHCGANVVDYWNHGSTFENYRNEPAATMSSWVAMAGDDLAGICWGYPKAAAKLDEELGRPVSERLIASFGPGARFGYMSAIGVAKQHEGKGMAARLLQYMHDDFLAQGLDVCVTRTMRDPERSVTYDWFLRKAFEVMTPDADWRGRVVMARPLDELVWAA
jgi:hypothetical protein